MGISPPTTKMPKDLAQYLRTNSHGWEARTGGKLFCVETVLNGLREPCYFMTDGGIKFRHEGDDDLCPSSFYLTVTTTQPTDRVVLFFTSSGSGKTVELAASSASRKRDLAILMSTKDTRELVKAQELYYSLRHEEKPENEISDAYESRQLKAAELLEKMIARLVRMGSCKDFFSDCKNLRDDPQIVLCLDEAVSCPVLVRSIIAERQIMGSVVADVLFGEGSQANVVFSVGGTGALRSTVGSHNDNFVPREPSANKVYQSLFNESLAGLKLLFPNGESQDVNFGTVDTHLPIISALLLNGRMNSIACSMFRKLPRDSKIRESELVDAIIIAFIDSNGVSKLSTMHLKQVMGACVFATILFQHRFEEQIRLPDDEIELELKYSQGYCGVEFANYPQRVLTGGESVTQYLMGQLGLIEPNGSMAWRTGAVIDRPFQLSTPQALVAFKLLGIELQDLVDLTPYGYEVLTTHVIKCALAAACVVAPDTRPSVKKTLEMIGFSPQSNLTDPAVIETWNALENWQPVFHGFSGNQPEAVRRNTHFVSVELEDVEGEEYCQIDSSLKTIINGMESINKMDMGVYAPLASINFGNSSVFDGCVLFFMQQTINHAIVRKATIMNQSKDYSDGSKLALSKLKTHADRCNDTVLDSVFGDLRLLCLSARETVVLGKRVSKYGRPFVPFIVNKSKILGPLLGILDSKRTAAHRKNHSCLHY